MYFDKEEYQIMQNLSKQTGLSKSALLRHLLRSSKYLDMANKLEKHNNLINEFPKTTELLNGSSGLDMNLLTLPLLIFIKRSFIVIFNFILLIVNVIEATK